MQDVGLRENRITVLWDSSSAPTTIRAPRRRSRTPSTVAAARRRPESRSSLYPGAGAVDHGGTAGSGRVRRLDRPRRARVPGRPGLHRRQRAERPASGSRSSTRTGRRGLRGLRVAAGRVVRRAQGRRPAINVIGVGLSPRGNDNPRARGNLSISPVRCIRDMGRAYRASKRTRPIMDELSFHPLPNLATDQLGRGYPWPNAGLANLDRIKQAVWDAFNGTGQPTFEEAGMPLRPRAHADAEAERGRLAGRHPGGLARRVLRQGERRDDRRGRTRRRSTGT